MKTVHRATTPKLQSAAQSTSVVIQRVIDLLADEIAKNSVEKFRAKGVYWGPRHQRPETVTYKTKDIERIIMELADSAVELNWWSTPTELRVNLTKPRSVK